MGSPPLAALQVRPLEQQPGPLDLYGKTLTLQSLMAGQKTQQLQQQGLQQQNDIQSQQLADAKAATAAMHQWDGKDVEDLPGLILKNGGSAQAVFGARDKIVAQKTALTKLDTDTLANNATKNDLLLGKLQSVTAGGDDGLPNRLNAAAQDAVRRGILDPQHAQMVQQMTASAPDAQSLRSQLSIFEKSLMGEKQQFDQEQKNRETTAAEVTAQSRNTTAQTGAQKFQAELPGGPLNRVSQEVAIQTNPDVQAGKVAVATAEANARAAADAAAARNGNEALANVPKNLIGPATGAAEKANKEYADAKSVSDRMNATMDAARKGNVVSYQIIPEEGTLQITTSQGVHRINKTEIDQYAGGGSLWQRMEGHFGRQLSGKTIPDSVLNDMAEIQDIQARGAQSRYQNTLKSINQTYGSGFKPVEMGGLGQPASARSGPPAGATHTAPGSDGKMHYTNTKGEDLGAVE